MARKTRYNKTGGTNLEELYRYELPLVDTPYVGIVYDTWDGGKEKDDIATGVERRTAIFRAGEEPEDITKAPWEFIDFRGLKGALVDTRVESMQEADYDAQEHEREYARLSQVPSWRTDDEHIPEIDLFFQAVDTVAKDPEDEEAWKVINEYRTAQLRMSERDAKNI